MAVLIPHFDYPFHFSSGHVAVVDQDTIDDITNCVAAILSTRQGNRLEAPDFGIEDLTFELQPLSLSGIIQSVLTDEPRAALLLDQHPDLVDQLIARITASVTQEVPS